MKKKKITISFAANDDMAFYIETLIRSDAMRIIQNKGGTAVKFTVENLPIENKNFEIRIPGVIYR